MFSWGSAATVCMTLPMRYAMVHIGSQGARLERQDMGYALGRECFAGSLEVRSSRPGRPGGLPS